MCRWLTFSGPGQSCSLDFSFLSMLHFHGRDSSVRCRTIGRISDPGMDSSFSLFYSPARRSFQGCQAISEMASSLYNSCVLEKINDKREKIKGGRM